MNYDENPFLAWYRFSSIEKKGLIVLIFIIFALIGLFIIIDALNVPKFIKSDYQFPITKIDTFYNNNNNDRISLNDESEHKRYYNNNKTIYPMVFDPDLVNYETLKSMNLSEKAIAQFLNYRNKGHEKGYRINSIEDFKKIYALKQYMDDLIPYLIFNPENKENKNTETKEPQSPQLTFEIDLNACDSAQLTKIKGIGPYWANKILKFRNYLGGFYSKNQYAEVFGITDEVIEILNKNTNLKSKHKLININSIQANKLPKHPYLKFQDFKKIIEYRNQHGLFKSLKDLELIYGINKDQLHKIYPYLTLD